MFKQLALAVLAIISLCVISCKKETCAKCEYIQYCATCTINGNDSEYCDNEPLDATERGCTGAGGTIKNKTTTITDTRELCDEDDAVVNAFMDEKVAQYYKCQYVD